MRAAIFLLLGGLLVWLVWNTFAGGSGQEERTLAASPGTMIPLDASTPRTPSADASTAVEEKPALAESSEEKAPKTVTEPAQAPLVPPAETVQPKQAAESRPPSAQAPAEEVALAAELLHRPATLDAWIASHQLAEPRKTFALALASLIAGDGEAARASFSRLHNDAAVPSSERELLRQALERSGRTAVPASLTRTTPLGLAAGMALAARDARELLAAGEHVEAAKLYSQLLLEEIRAPWAADATTLAEWTGGLKRAQERHRWSKDAAWPSVEIEVADGDSLITVRKRALRDHPGLVLCTGLIDRANQLHGGVIHPGQKLRIPTEPAHMLVDLDARWAFYLFGNEVADAWQVGIGKENSETEPGTFVVGEKTEDPMWFRAGHKPVPHGDPENPLGSRWIAWFDQAGNKTGLGFHGTSDPSSIGKSESQGCIRMRNEEVEALFEILPVGARVEVQR